MAGSWFNAALSALPTFIFDSTIVPGTPKSLVEVRVPFFLRARPMVVSQRPCKTDPISDREGE